MSFEFLTGVAYLDGRAAGRQGVAEFPPHPDRVFMALVAAWGGRDFAERRALEWLEAAGTPSILASESRDRPTLTVYSPGNDDLQNYEGGERNVDRRVSSTVPDSPRITYSWSSEPPQEVRQSLDALVGRVTYLGRSESMVTGWISSLTESPTWVPVDQGSHMLRVSYPGRLADLAADYGAGIRPRAAAWQGYQRSNTPSFGHSEWETMWTFEIEGPADLRHTLKLAKSIRACLLAACPDPVPSWVSGHSSDGAQLRDSHIGVVPLANVGHAYGDGRVLGIGLTIPRASNVAERVRCLSRLFATPHRVGDGMRVRQVTSTAATLNPDLWCAPSRSWGTVTPIACHRWPKGNVVKVLSTDIAHAGLPQPDAIEVRATSPIVGGLFGPPLDAPNRYRTHAVIHWANPVRGPIAIGAARYMGMGFCRGIA